MTMPEGNDQEYTPSQKEFLKSPDEIRELIRNVLASEREVMHLQRRPEIHQKILNHVKSAIR